MRAATDFVAVASEHIALKRVGRRWVGLCPFHTEKSASFSVNAEEGLYYCFGCGAGGDAIRFVQEVEHLDFADAVERLAARAGIQVHYDTVAVSQERQRRAPLLEAMEKAVEWYHQRLLTGRDAGAGEGLPAQPGLRRRRGPGLPAGVGARRLGRAVQGPAAAGRRPPRHAAWAGSTSIGRQQDVFRARLLFPIFDVRGDASRLRRTGPARRPGAQVQELARVAALRQEPDALRAQLGQGRRSSTSSEVVVCEGYTDVIGLAAVGRPRAVATCGTALTEDHFRALKNFARRVVLAYDADAAGQAAAARFYEWERRFEVDIAVAALPAGADPGEPGPAAIPTPSGPPSTTPARSSPSASNGLLAGADLRTAEGKARAAEAAMAVVREHPSDLVRDQYVMQVADRVAHPRRPPAAAAGGPSAGSGPGDAEPPAGGADPVPGGAGRAGAGGPAGRRPPARRRWPTRLHEVLFADPTILAGYRALCALDHAATRPSPGPNPTPPPSSSGWPWRTTRPIPTT